jgi:hypothetical protein
VAVVQRSHRRHQADAAAERSRAIARAAEVGNRLDKLHRSASLGSGLGGPDWRV